MYDLSKTDFQKEKFIFYTGAAKLVKQKVHFMKTKGALVKKLRY